jgi:hypothetical protein
MCEQCQSRGSKTAFKLCRIISRQYKKSHPRLINGSLNFLAMSRSGLFDFNNELISGLFNFNNKLTLRSRHQGFGDDRWLRHLPGPG